MARQTLWLACKFVIKLKNSCKDTNQIVTQSTCLCFTCRQTYLSDGEMKRWLVRLPPRPEGTAYTMSVVTSHTCMHAHTHTHTSPPHPVVIPLTLCTHMYQNTTRGSTQQNLGTLLLSIHSSKSSYLLCGRSDRTLHSCGITIS